MGNHEDILSDSNVIVSADFRGDTIELRAQNEVCRRCIFLFLHPPASIFACQLLLSLF
jgi:hypothetical protein